MLLGYTVARQAPLAAVERQLPYTVLLVRTEEGVQLVSGLAGDGHLLRCGQPLEVFFEPLGDDLGLPRFRPV